MLARTRVAFKFMTYGLLIGVLFAPRSGSETRKSLMNWAKSSVSGLFGGMSGGA